MIVDKNNKKLSSKITEVTTSHKSYLAIEFQRKYRSAVNFEGVQQSSIAFEYLKQKMLIFLQ